MRNINFLLCYILLNLLFCFTSNCYAQQLSKDKIQKIDSLFAQWNNSDKPGVAVGILWRGNIVYQKGFGMANIKEKEPVTSTTAFWIASVSKQFTAMGITALVQQGLINLDEPAAKYLPEIKQFPNITIGHILHHSSGLRDGFTLIGLTFRSEKHYDPESVLEMVAQQTKLNFEPGTQYEYVNSNYVLLSTIIERVSKQPFESFMRKHIFEPLGMINSQVFSEAFPLMARGYIAKGEKYREIKKWLKAKGSTGVITTLEDLFEMEKKFHQKNVSLLSAMSEQVTLSDGTQSFYARGVEIYNIGDKKVISHFGSDPGFRADILRIPKDDLSIIILSNAGNYWDLMKHQLRMAGIVLDYEPLIEQSQPVREIKMQNENLVLDGIYQDTTSISEIRIIKKENGFLKTATSISGYYAPLVPINYNRFQSTNVYESEYIFEGDNLLVQLRDGNHTFLRRKEQPETDLSKWKGRYYSKELNKTYRITYRKNRLRLSLFRVYHIPFKSIGNQLFIADFMGNNVIKFSQSLTGEQIMQFSREGVKNLLFIKL